MPSVRQNLWAADLFPLFSGELTFYGQHASLKGAAIPKSFDHDRASRPFDLEDVILRHGIDPSLNLQGSRGALEEPDHRRPAYQ